MNCSCKKGFCQNNRCKCVKNVVKCSTGCTCSPLTCKNRLLETNEEVPQQDISWEEWSEVCRKMTEFARMRNNEPVPEKLKGLLQQMSVLMDIDLSTRMEHLSVHDSGVLRSKEWQEFEKGLVECKGCSRKFISERIEVHENICLKKKICKSRMK